ncbi:SH3 domain-containing protein [Leptospira mtsangambouensis]|uniref:SH3 domain-containing protein n=1 Tax=Leptospira mtsangambouensis TaxID=2484912 RepID=UPI001EEA78BF|nr:SH3 domain-containing protein [Leptospira mtsangambouensis]MCG6142734.1 SH3 domain-containing protein [Leptospira mtsangambouensis]
MKGLHSILIAIFIFSNIFCKENTEKKSQKESEYFYNIAKPNLNIRKDPSELSAKIGSIEFGKIVTVISKEKVPAKIDNINGFWVKIEHKGSIGWVFDSYLSKELDSFYLVGKILKTEKSPSNSYFYILKSTDEYEERCDEEYNSNYCFFVISDDKNIHSQVFEKTYPLYWDKNDNLIGISKHNDGDYIQIDYSRFNKLKKFQKEELITYTFYFKNNMSTHLLPDEYNEFSFKYLKKVCKDSNCFYFIKPTNSTEVLVEYVKSGIRHTILKIENDADFTLETNPENAFFYKSDKKFEIDFINNKAKEL